ncbi:DNA helicase (DNA repair), Rad3 type [Parasponia andersonii]|uniref:DNA helicase (DNA repair), Rad3 type n=1 Tax=Parasponia andersonii TaxID=3476 RepID=A0A2P5AEL2_PARAD|nr:DNA helicase (DNA repair), Rad3 type [Parasponia andersonii]
MSKMEDQKAEAPKFQGFPYKPYSIQIDFMNALYQSLNNGGVSILESPTGTGKTLSIICSALQWVIDQRHQQKSEKRVESDQHCAKGGEFDLDDEPDWMRNFVVNKDDQGQDKKIKNRKIRVGIGKGNFGRNHHAGCRELLSEDVEKDCCRRKEGKNVSSDVVELSDKEFLLEEYESEEEGALGDGKSKRKTMGVSLSSSSDEEGGDGSGEKDEEEGKLKVYFCSRTHSQLSQFIKELRKTVFSNEMKVVCLGSRKNFCINEEVLMLGNPARINERCLELQKKNNDKVSKIKNLGAGGRLRRTKASSGCPMLRKYKLQKQFRSEISQQGAMDIEDLVHLGRSMKTCPYYGSRSFVSAADLIVLPYQSLLSKSSRESLGLNLKNSIVIIDEAHNLADSLLSMYDSKITLLQLEDVHYHIEKYFERFRNLLGPGNRRYIQTLMVICQAFLQTLCNKEDASFVDSSQHNAKASEANLASYSSMAINEFLFSLNIDNINLIKLCQYLNESNIMHKVSAYGDQVVSLQKSLASKGTVECGEDASTLSNFRALADMLLSLTNKDGDGRIIISRTRPARAGQQGGYLKYVMLTGEKIFSEILDEAHAVVLAGGTLQPIEETRERLFPWLLPKQLHFFSCSHIVPPESILPVTVSCGPSGQSFDFSYSSRSSTKMIQELGLLLCNLTVAVPEGIVLFFSSFDYEGLVYDAWNASGILERILKKKRVFREPRKNTDVECVLKEYKETIDKLSAGGLKDNPTQTGAILLAVVGGKISEGINLSDGMGRCIVMVGLPYPSPSDFELMERVKFIEGLGNPNPMKTSNPSVNDEINNGGDAKAGFDVLRSCRHRGKEYYENLCMKAVNQSIGRAIRHINDYAAILLVDTRYAYTDDSSKGSFSHPTSKLPEWIKGRLVSTDNYGDVHRMLHQFFKHNKNRGF